MTSKVPAISPSHDPSPSTVKLCSSEESINENSCHSNVGYESDNPPEEVLASDFTVKGQICDKNISSEKVNGCVGSSNTPSKSIVLEPNLTDASQKTFIPDSNSISDTHYQGGSLNTAKDLRSSPSPKGIEKASADIPLEMQPEETPIIKGNEVKGTIVSSNEKNGASDKAAMEEEDGNWQSMKMGTTGFKRPFMQKHNPLPTDPTLGERMKYSLLCPPHGTVGRWLTYVLLFALLWGSMVYIVKDQALPGGTLFSLLILVVVAQIGGIIVSKLKLPPLLGMLLVGITFRSAPVLDVIGTNIATEWSSGLRSMALVVILIRAGLGLDPEALRKLSFVVLRLAMIPCLTETTTVAVVSHFLLGFPWKWGFLLGFILAAVSPAVVVPCLLNLAEQGYGVEKGIPTLVIAAASIDDVLAISGFGVCLGMIFSHGSAAWEGIKGPLEIVMGISYGVIVGVILWALPNKKHESAIGLRVLLLFCSGLLAVFGSKGIDFGGAGALACLCVAFVAGYGWRKQGKIPNKTQVNEYFNFMWMFFQPMLFGLIGTEIRISELQMSTVGWGVVTLMIGLTLRVIVSFFAVMGGNLTLKERFFVALAWLPKATVQAAIGSTALDYAREANKDGLVESVEEMMGAKVLTIAVLVILITAPIGAVAIMLSAPKLLKKAPPPSLEEKEKGGDAES